MDILQNIVVDVDGDESDLINFGFFSFRFVFSLQQLQQTVAQAQQQSAIHLITTGSVGTPHTHYHHSSVATSGVTPPPSAAPTAALSPPPSQPTLSQQPLPSISSQSLQSPLHAQISAGRPGAHNTSMVVTNQSTNPSKIVCSAIRSQQPHLGHATGATNTLHNFAREVNKPVAAVTPLSLSTSVFVPPTITALNPALFAATIQQQQQQQVQQLQAVAAKVAQTAAITSTPQSQPPQSALLIGIDTITQDKKTTGATGSILPTVGTSRKKNFQPDSRWSGSDDKLLFLAGPRLK